MPRDLADVLHYFMPELVSEEDPPHGSTTAQCPPAPPPPVAAPAPQPTQRFPLATIPVADSDLVRASLVASLAEEISGVGGDATILTPNTPNAHDLFPTGLGESPGARVEQVDAESLGELHAQAAEFAVGLANEKTTGGVILVRVPPGWLRCADEVSELLDWLLLFSSPDQRNLSDTYALAAWILRENPAAEIGVTIHGASGRREAEDAFGLLARNIDQHFGRTLASYGLLLEDLDIYRSLVAGQTVGRAHPESPASVALRETAKLVFERARKAELN